MINKNCPLTDKEKLYKKLHGLDFCTYKNQQAVYCQNCSKRFTIEKAFGYFKELAKDLNAVYSFNFAREVVDFVREEYGVEITVKMVENFAKKYK